MVRGADPEGNPVGSADPHAIMGMEEVRSEWHGRANVHADEVNETMTRAQRIRCMLLVGAIFLFGTVAPWIASRRAPERPAAEAQAPSEAQIPPAPQLS